MKKIKNPHDKLFRDIWSDKQITIDFIENYLPSDILKLIKTDTLDISKDSFIDKEFEDYYSDLLFKINMGDDLNDYPGFIYLLFEHKSYPDKLTPLQVLEYMTKIWRLHLKQQNNTSLPVIITMVLYHGKAAWTFGNRLSNLMETANPEIDAYFPDFQFILHDLSQYSDEQIKGNILNRTILLLFKHIRDPDIVQKLPHIFSLMKEAVITESGLRYLEAVLRYIFSTVDNISTREVRHMVEQTISSEKGDLIMTLAEKWEKEGYVKGVMEAIELGLDLRFGDQARWLMDIVQKIQDINKLRQIKDSIKKVRDLSELQVIVESNL